MDCHVTSRGRKAPAGEDSQDISRFVFSAGIPDRMTQSFQVAEVEFAPDRVRGAENLLFNYAMGEVQELGRFLGAWHRARITYDMTTYTGSVWIDSRPIVVGVPLKADLDVRSVPEISLSSSTVAVKLWIDDLEVRFVDLSRLGQDRPEVVFRPLFRDNFERYGRALFPEQGGWRVGPGQAAGGEKGLRESSEESGRMLSMGM